MDKNDSLLAFITTVFTAFVALFFIIVVMDFDGVSFQTASGYANTIREDALAVYPNTVTDANNDFFIVTEEDQTIYVKVTKENNVYTHSETEVTEDTEELLTMKTASIEAKTNKSAQAKSNSDFLWKGLTLYSFYKIMK